MLSMKDLAIDAEFEAIHADDRHEGWQLELLLADIKKRGWTANVHHWQGLIIDGHTRYDLWEKHFNGTDFPEPTIVELHFNDREEAKEYIRTHSSERRNLSDEKMAYFRGKYLLNEKEPVANGKPEGHTGNGLSPKRRRPKGVKNSTALAQKLGVSRMTAHRDEQYAKQADSLVDRGVAELDDVLKADKQTVRRAAKATTNTEAKQILAEGRARKNTPVAMTENEIAKRFAAPLRQLEAMSKQFPSDRFKTIEDEIRAWCADAIREAASESGE